LLYIYQNLFSSTLSAILHQEKQYSYLPLLLLSRIIGNVIKHILLMEYFLNWKRIVIIISLALIIVACSSQDDTSGQNAEIVPTSDLANAGLVARVNGVGIAQADYNRALERRSSANVADLNALARQVLNELIEQELINQNASTLNINITDADVQAEINAQRDIAGSDTAWQASLARNDYTEDEWIAAQFDVLVTLGVRNQLLNPYFGDIEQINARHIVVRQREEAELVLNRLNNGEGFASLAAEFSIDVTTRETGGNLGWFARNELFYANLEEIAFSLELGQIAGPIATSLGYHIIQTMDKAIRPVEAERLPTLSENIFNTWLDEQYQNANIEIYVQW
jgi:foldase protein PrsA